MINYRLELSSQSLRGGSCSNVNRQTILAALLFFALGFLIFHPALSVGFVSDDFIWLMESQNLQQFDPFDTQSLAFTKGRPGTMVLFLVLHKLFSADAGRFHLVMLVFHILNAVLLFAVLRRFQLPFHFNFTAALIFLIHFTNEETLFWVSCVSSIFCLFFYLGAIYFYLKDLKNGSLIFKTVVLGCSLIALSIREDALTIPVTLTVLHFLRTRKENVRIFDLWRRDFIFSIPAPIFLGYRRLSAAQESMGYAFSANPAVWVQNGLYFIFNLCVPIRFIFDQVSWGAHEKLRPLIIALKDIPILFVGGVLVLAAVVFLTFRFRNRISGLAKVGATLAAIGLLPYFALVGNAPRFLYFALIGGAIVMAQALFWMSERIYRNRPGRVAAFFGAVLVGASFFIIRERGQWWVKSSQLAFEIIEQTKVQAGSLRPGDTMYVASLPHRLQGAHVFHQGGYSAWSPFEEAIALHAPELAGRVRYLGDKSLDELQEYKGRKVFTFKDGKLQEVLGF